MVSWIRTLGRAQFASSCYCWVEYLVLGRLQVVIPFPDCQSAPHGHGVEVAHPLKKCPVTTSVSCELPRDSTCSLKLVAFQRVTVHFQPNFKLKLRLMPVQTRLCLHSMSSINNSQQHQIPSQRPLYCSTATTSTSKPDRIATARRAAMHSTLIRRSLGAIIPPKIATPNSIVRRPARRQNRPNLRFSYTQTGGSGASLTPLVEFYSKLPKGPAPASAVRGIKAKYFVGENVSGMPLVLAIAGVFGLGYTIDYNSECPCRFRAGRDADCWRFVHFFSHKVHLSAYPPSRSCLYPPTMLTRCLNLCRASQEPRPLIHRFLINFTLLIAIDSSWFSNFSFDPSEPSISTTVSLATD